MHTLGDQKNYIPETTAVTGNVSNDNGNDPNIETLTDQYPDNESAIEKNNDEEEELEQEVENRFEQDMYNELQNEQK